PNPTTPPPYPTTQPPHTPPPNPTSHLHLHLHCSFLPSLGLICLGPREGLWVPLFLVDLTVHVGNGLLYVGYVLDVLEDALELAAGVVGPQRGGGGGGGAGIG